MIKLCHNVNGATSNVNFFLLCFFLLLTLQLSAFAALDLSEIGVGARPLGLGSAFVGAADDASAIFTNPAGLAQNDGLNIMSMSGAMLGDANYLLLGAADITPLGKFGFGYVNASVGSIPLTALVGSGPSQEANQYGSADYGSNQLVFAYGSKLSRFLKNGAGSNLAIGASLKIFSQGFTGGAVPPSGGANPLNNATGAGLDADLGLLWAVEDWATLGLVFQNFLPESFGGKFVWDKNSVTEGIPEVTRVGGRFHLLGPLLALRPFDDKTLDMMLDYQNNDALGRPAAWHLGLEYQPFNQFFLRCGLDQQPKAAESGVGVDNNLAFGVGFVFAGFSFDYAYHQYGDLSDNTSHFFSLGYRGEDKPTVRARSAKAEKKTVIPPIEIAAKPLLKVFSDVPENYWAFKPIQYMTTLGYLDGFADGTFKPTREITRGELAVLLVKAKGFIVNQSFQRRFSDVSAQSEGAPYISLAVDRKYLTGFPDGTFQPDKRITRAEAAVTLARFAGLDLKPKLEQKPFADIPVKHWAAPSIAAGKQAGLYEYLAGKGFGPNLYLTRAEIAEMISKTAFVKQKIEKLISGE
jgi:hypothetical protein